MKRRVVLTLAMVSSVLVGVGVAVGSVQTNGGPERQLAASSPPLNALEWGRASKLLAKALELMKERGFQQSAVKPTSRVCVSTALERAFLEQKIKRGVLTGRPDEVEYTIVDFNYAREALSRLLKVQREPTPDPKLRGLAVPYWGRYFMNWNNVRGRTEQDSLDLLTRASKLAANLRKKALRGG